jgi:large subunit ribosomal protein L29
MKMEELKQLPVTELEHRLEDIQEEIQNLRFQHATHQLDNPLRLRTLRKDVARINTIISEIKLGIRVPVQ